MTKVHQSYADRPTKTPIKRHSTILLGAPKIIDFLHQKNVCGSSRFWLRQRRSREIGAILYLGREKNARLDHLRQHHHSCDRADRLLSSLAGGAGAPKTWVDFRDDQSAANTYLHDLSSNCQPRPILSRGFKLSREISEDT